MMGSWLQRRSGRKEYWISVAALTAISVVFSLANVPGSFLGIVWLLIWVKRLHDINMSGWLALIPIVVGGLLFVLGAVIEGREFGNALVYVFEDPAAPATQEAVNFVSFAILGALAVQFVFTVWLGVKAGDPGPNRFGPAPGSAAEKA